MTYGKQLENISVLKRIGFLSELFDMNQLSNFRAEILKLINDPYVLLDPIGGNTGTLNTKWKIRVNIPQENLLSIINKTY